MRETNPCLLICMFVWKHRLVVRSYGGRQSYACLQVFMRGDSCGVYCTKILEPVVTASTTCVSALLNVRPPFHRGILPKYVSICL